jgi:hypothetical protein
VLAAGWRVRMVGRKQGGRCGVQDLHHTLSAQHILAAQDRHAPGIGMAQGFSAGTL